MERKENQSPVVFHTPLPWRHGDAYHDPGRGENIFIGSDDVVVATTGDIGGFPKEANADLVLTSVNARPKVEELIALATDFADQHTDDYDAAVLRSKAREVEAALKGKA